MASNQEQHIVYQQPFPTYQSAQLGVWNQPPAQTVTYIPYHQGEVQTYADKASFGGYPPLAYAPDSSQQQYAAPAFAQSAQWQYQPAGQAHFIPTYAQPFNAMTDPSYQQGPPHQLHRLPQTMKRDDFHGAIGMMENPAQSAAAYTASWVSSTSSIPPEMRDEPECDIPQDWEGHVNPNGPWPVLNEDSRLRADRNGRKPERALTEQGRELTFDERLQKAKMQKSRVENDNGENSNGGSASTPPAQSGSGGRGGSRPIRGGRGGGGGGRGGGSHNGSDRRPPRETYRQDGQHQPQPHQQMQIQQQPHQRDGDAGSYGGYNGGRGVRHGGAVAGNVGGMVVDGVTYAAQPMGMINQVPQVAQMQYQPQQQPMYAPQQQYVVQAPMQQGYIDPQFYATMNAFQNTHLSYGQNRRMPLLPGPFGMISQPAAIQQDAKFRNTWLDAQNFVPFGGMFQYPDHRIRGGYRGRGRGSSFRGTTRRYERRDEPRGDNETSPESEKNGQIDDDKPSSSDAAQSVAVPKSAPQDAKKEAESLARTSAKTETNDEVKTDMQAASSKAPQGDKEKSGEKKVDGQVDNGEESSDNEYHDGEGADDDEDDEDDEDYEYSDESEEEQDAAGDEDADADDENEAVEKPTVKKGEKNTK